MDKSFVMFALTYLLLVVFFVTVSPFEAEYLGVDNSYMMITNLKEIFLFTWGLIVGWKT